MCPKTGQKSRKIKVLRFAADILQENREIIMGITPIPGIRTLPAVKAPQGEFSPPEVLDIDGSARPGDGDGQRGGRKGSGAEENDEDDLMLEPETEPGAEAEGGSRQVDYFA